jgi:surface protein
MIRRFFHSTIKDKNAFIFEINTANTSTGSTTNTQFKLPFPSTGNYNCVVDWGDNTSDVITVWNQDEVTHTYASTGTYTVTISGICRGWQFTGSGDRLKMINISQWGILNFTNGGGQFQGCSNLDVTATDIPNLSSVTNLTRFFNLCSSLTYNSSVNNWDVSSITNLFEMFRGSSFNQSISDWDVSLVTNFGGVFRDSSFNQNINSWDVSSATNINNIFAGNSTFNQPLSNWDISNVTSLAGIFFQAFAFNQNINTWDVSNVTNMPGVFRQATSFNQPLSDWDVSNVTIFGGANNGMFFNASSFNQDISSWDVSSATNMQDMFRNATAFNQDIGSWDVSKVSVFTNFMAGKTAANYSATNLDSIYNGWSLLTFVNTGLSISFGTVKYTAAGQAGRDILTDPPNNWTITDGGI